MWKRTFGGALFFLFSLAAAQDLGAAQTSAQQLEQVYKKGVDLFRSGDLAAAEAEFKRVVELAPGTAESHFFLGKIAAAREAHDEAVSRFQTALQMNPGFVEARHSLGVSFLGAAKYSDAKAAFEQVIRERPSDGLAHVNLGTVYVQLGEPHTARPHYLKALEIQGKDPAVRFHAHYHLGLLSLRDQHYADAVGHLEPALSLQPEHSGALLALAACHFKLQQRKAGVAIASRISRLPAAGSEVLIRSGLLLVENNEFAEAVQILEKARAFGAPSFELLYGLGTAYEQMGRHVDAVAIIQEALRRRPQAAEGHFLLAKAYAALQNPLAVQSLKQCLEIKPRRDEVWEALSQEIIKQGLFSQGIEIFQRYVERFPQKPLSHLLLGEIFMHQPDLASALAEFQKARELDPTMARAHFSAGFIYKELAQNDQARESFELALRHDPGQPLANFHLGELVLESDPDRAESLLKRALQANAGYAEAHAKLGQLYFKQRRYDEAVASLRSALQLKPELSPAYYVLGQAYLKLGHRQKAQEALQKFQELEAKDQQLRQRGKKAARNKQ
ncbi:MAG: tetratricopeptide repeat protein [Acidobacteria bacterium]|nr:tetratricopeptide repeat protein [Acidobacteriota bacterium]